MSIPPRISGFPKAKQAIIIGPRTRRNFSFLYMVYSTPSPKQRWNLIQNASRDELLAIIDVSSNLSRSSFRLTAKQKRRLERYRQEIRRLSRARSEEGARAAIQYGEGLHINPLATRKRDRLKVIQRGGFLQALLVPVLTELAAEVIDRLIPEKK